MKSYKETFYRLKKKKEGALVAFTVMGDPDFDTSLEIAKAIVENGADILELGLPFSDPIADGPTIQAADIRALEKGFNTDKAFEFARKLRKEYDVPIGFLVYYNIVFQHGEEKFYKDAKEAGVNSVLVADVPLEEFDALEKYAKKYRVDSVLTVSPLTSDERMKKITARAGGFVYVISRLGITGARKDMHSGTIELLKRARKVTSKPLCAGFGISRPEHVRDVIKAGADGAIVGSAIVNIIGKNIGNKGRMMSEAGKYVREMKEATKF